MKQEDIKPMSDQPDGLAKVIHQTNENCQVFNGPMTGCVFAMPGSTVNNYPNGTTENAVEEKTPTEVKVDESMLKPFEEDSKNKILDVDVEALWTALTARLDRLDSRMTFADDRRKDWSVKCVKKVVMNAINKDNLPLNESLKNDVLTLRYWCIKRKGTAAGRCLDLTLMNMVGYIVGKGLIPNRETSIVKSMYPEATKIEVDMHKSALKNGYGKESAFGRRFGDLLDNSIERVCGRG